MYTEGCMECGGRSSCHLTSPSLGARGGRAPGHLAAGESGSAKGTWASGSVGVGMSVWSGPAATAGEVPGCGCGAGTGHCFFSRVVMVTSCLAALAMS